MRRWGFGEVRGAGSARCGIAPIASADSLLPRYARRRDGLSPLDEVQPEPVRRDQASSRQRLRQIPAGPRSRDCASPSTDGKGMTPDPRHCAGTVWVSRGPVSCLTRPSTARFDGPRVCPSTLAPKGREPVCGRVREIRLSHVAACPDVRGRPHSGPVSRIGVRGRTRFLFDMEGCHDVNLDSSPAAAVPGRCTWHSGLRHRRFDSGAGSDIRSGIRRGCRPGRSSRDRGAGSLRGPARRPVRLRHGGREVLPARRPLRNPRSTQPHRVLPERGAPRHRGRNRSADVHRLRAAGAEVHGDGVHRRGLPLLREVPPRESRTSTLWGSGFAMRPGRAARRAPRASHGACRCGARRIPTRR